jgi:hypothetical protein
MSARFITKVLGGRWCGTYGLVKCPAHEDRLPSLKISDDQRKRDGIDLHCFAGCDWRDIKSAFARLGLIERSMPTGPDPARKRPSATLDSPQNDARDRIDAALRIWRVSAPLKSAATERTNFTAGWRYFVERRQLCIGLLDDLSHCLRWQGGIGAVVALMTDPLTNKPCGVHRTFLNPDATKRERKMLGKAGVIRLSPDEDVLEGLGICEGIEDGLAILLSGWAPIWAANSCGAIERFPILAGIECLTIFADDDEPGMKAARACAERWTSAGREARLSRLRAFR